MWVTMYVGDGVYMWVCSSSPENRLMQDVGGHVARVHVAHLRAGPDLLQRAHVVARHVRVVLRTHRYKVIEKLFQK